MRLKQEEEQKRLEEEERIVIKGRQIYENIAEWKRFHKDVQIKESDDEDDNQYLYYSSEDD